MHVLGNDLNERRAEGAVRPTRGQPLPMRSQMSKPDRPPLNDLWTMADHPSGNCADPAVKRRLAVALGLVILSSSTSALAPMVFEADHR